VFQKVAQSLLQPVDPSKLQAIALCGTFPTGIDGTLYDFLVRLKPSSCILLLDAYRGIEATLKSTAVDILKINGDEARALMNWYLLNHM
jgi:fructose-1-phosphate kinase PfkB-like protein